MRLSFRFGLALAISSLLHLLVLWLSSHHEIELKTSPRSSLSKTVRLSLESPMASHSKSQPFMQDSTKKVGHGQPETAPSQTLGKSPQPRETLRERARSDASAAIRHDRKQITTARIRETATEEARTRAIEDITEHRTPTPSISSKLDRALNPPREPPGVRTMADGTLRVVTEFGTTYCIRPKEDWRILGPEDDLPVSMTCRY